VAQIDGGGDNASPRKEFDWTPALLAVLFTIVASAFFFAFPQTDLWFSRLFYEPGAGFPLAHSEPLTAFRNVGKVLVPGVGIAALVALFLALGMPKRRPPLPINSALFLLWSLALGPGLVVNGILKPLWGRPRPTGVIAFGGKQPFVDAWQISNHCTWNCSFVSGEGSGAMWLVAVALVVPLAWRRPVAAVMLVLALGLSLTRIAEGGHFLSDVLIGWGLTLTVMALVYQVFVVRQPAWADFASLDAVARLAGRIREANGVQNAGRVLIAAAGVAAAGFALFGQSTWLQENDLHERVEALGAVMIAACILGLAWYAFNMPWRLGRGSIGAPPSVATLQTLRIAGAVGVAAQFGSVAFALASGVAALAAFALGLFDSRRPEAVAGAQVGTRVAPVTVQVLIGMSLFLVLSIPVAEAIEHLQDTGRLHVLMRLP
jgi:membrane-associated PAP2 superfamily phosphatase